MDTAREMNRILLFLFVFMTAGVHWGWGTQWVAGFFGILYVIGKLVQLGFWFYDRMEV